MHSFPVSRNEGSNYRLSDAGQTVSNDEKKKKEREEIKGEKKGNKSFRQKYGRKIPKNRGDIVGPSFD